MPDQGEVIFDCAPIRPEDVARIGYLPEERGLYKKMKVGEQAIYLAQLKGLSASEARKRLQFWFEKFGIMPWWNKKLEELSKGMQQKVQFIITILHEPPLLILDEPFSGFDPVNAELLKREILELRDKGHTIIFSTHNMASVEEICDNIALINHSKVVLQGNVEEIRNQYRSGIYEVSGTGSDVLESCADYEVIDHHRVGSIDHYQMRKSEALSNTALIRLLSEQLDIRTFNEKLPTMHEIFLKVVGE
jgi:ABC-2 type transport system ATP-binding protein